MTQIATETTQTSEGEVAIAIEVDKDQNRLGLDSRGGKGKEIPTKAFSKAIELIRTCAEQLSQTVERVAEQARPQCVEVQLAIK